VYYIGADVVQEYMSAVVVQLACTVVQECYSGTQVVQLYRIITGQGSRISTVIQE
jgi:hypothetical protein